MEGVALLEIVHGQMYYSNKQQLAEAFGVSLGTVHRRKIGLKKNRRDMVIMPLSLPEQISMPT